MPKAITSEKALRAAKKLAIQEAATKKAESLKPRTMTLAEMQEVARMRPRMIKSHANGGRKPLEVLTPDELIERRVTLQSRVQPTMTFYNDPAFDAFGVAVGSAFNNNHKSKHYARGRRANQPKAKATR